MSMEVSRGGMSQPAVSSHAGNNSVSLPGGGQIMPVGINGSILEETAKLCVSMREAIAAADAGMRSCQVR